MKHINLPNLLMRSNPSLTKQGLQAAEAAGPAGQPLQSGSKTGGIEPASAEPELPAAAPLTQSGFSKKYFALGLLFGLMLVAGIAYTQKDRYSDRIAQASRNILGDENTARIESWYFAVQDKTDKLKFKIFGGDTNPFGEETAASEQGRPISVVGPSQSVDMSLSFRSPYPMPLALPEIKQLSPNPQQGEGIWTTAGLPRSSPENVLMAKTFIRPDTSRPYAVVGVLLLDKRRIRLHITGGTEDPGGDLGVKGPGVIPDDHRKTVLAAWNGGFRGPHGGFGMYADGKQYRPLRNGFASVVVMKDGTMKIGEWGKDLTWSDDMVAVRQNAILLVDNCEVSKRTGEGNATWGYVQVNSAEFITWRSAIGLTKNGDLLIAAGNSLSADSLARALWAAGACYAMQLDINTPYVLASLYFPQEDGSLEGGQVHGIHGRWSGPLLHGPEARFHVRNAGRDELQAVAPFQSAARSVCRLGIEPDYDAFELRRGSRVAPHDQRIVPRDDVLRRVG